MINGFLHTEGKKIVDGQGKEVLLTGWGLGNWLLMEGYMWLGGQARFDRPRRIEAVLEELAGREYMEQFWKTFRRDYIRREDIQYMAQLGYNSVRIPINWRVLMEEGPGIRWKEDGFRLLDNCLEWCEEAGMYAFFDLHGAPGGQTGANIDDSIDDVPRLFIDEDSRQKALALWRELAVRYGSREVVGGYDLLNEPIAPYYPGRKDFDHLIPALAQFYRDAIAVIRQVDKVHLFSLEGPHWATALDVFNEKYDDNMVLHFHRYAELPHRKILDAYIKKAEEWNIPLWLGETGENLNEWYAALYPLCISLGIGYNLWPWKKMACTNSPCSIRKPKDYDLLMQYVEGGPHPGFEKAQEILNEYLELIRLENCDLHPEVTGHVFRQVPFSMLAADFDELPGKGISYSGTAEENPATDYREGCGMYLAERDVVWEKRFAFDCGADRYALKLTAGEFAEYTISGCEKLTVRLTVTAGAAGSVLVSVRPTGWADEGQKMCETIAQKECVIGAGETSVEASFELAAAPDRLAAFDRQADDRLTVRIAGLEGCVILERLSFE
ncbi:MAG: cellulase family glycosylhydrolase [Lachnospiraceae bacterium]|nr:cellulase family glycosylhydrolase [Lachnospiraceae bacterium]